MIEGRTAALPPPEPRRRCYWPLLAFFMVGLLAGGTETSRALGELGFSSLSLDPGGNLHLDDLTLDLAYRTPENICVNQSQLKAIAGFPQLDDQSWKTQVNLPLTATKEGTLSETLSRTGEKSLALSYQFTAPQAITSRVVNLTIHCPGKSFANGKFIMDGAPFPLAGDPSGSFTGTMEKTTCRSLVLPLSSQTITIGGNFLIWVHCTASDFTAYVNIPNDGDADGKIGLNLTITLEPAPAVSIPLAEQANFGPYDLVPGPRQEANQLAALPAGTLPVSDTTFQLLDPNMNGSNLVGLGGDGADHFPRSLLLPVLGHPLLKHLYLLHTLAGDAPSTLVGTMTVMYVDRTEKKFTIAPQREVGSWHALGALENGAIGWSESGKSDAACLFFSRFDLDGKAVTMIYLTCTSPTPWIIAGISGATH